MYEPTNLASVMKDDHTKTRKEDTVRCRVLNSLIHKAVSEMMSTGEVNQELHDLKLEICKASEKSYSFCWAAVTTTWGWCGVLKEPPGIVMHAGRVLQHCCCTAKWASVHLSCKESFATVAPHLVDLCQYNANATWANQKMVLLVCFCFSCYLYMYNLYCPFRRRSLIFTNTNVSFQESLCSCVRAYSSLSPLPASLWPKWVMSLEQKSQDLRQWHWQARFQKELEFVANCVSFCHNSQV